MSSQTPPPFFPPFLFGQNKKKSSFLPVYLPLPKMNQVFCRKGIVSSCANIYGWWRRKEGSSRNLDQTPTWAVSGVCAVIILISIALEKILHKVGTWLTEWHKKALYEALEKVKAELMILGFISLILVFSQYYIAGICIPINVADTMSCRLPK